jgi:hypothetical protein
MKTALFTALFTLFVIIGAIVVGINNKNKAEQVAFNQQVDNLLNEKPLPKVDEQAAFNANMDKLLGFEPRKPTTVKEVAKEWAK